MKKESLKTAALVLLVFCSIILTINKWFSEKLWPDGYNFFSNLTSYFSFGEKPVKKTYYLSKENISNPSKIIVNNNELRALYTNTSVNYNTMLPMVKSILKSGLSEKEFSQTTPEKWKDSLKGASVYIAYPVSYDAKTFSAIMDTAISDFGIASMKEFIIAFDNDSPGKAHMLINDDSAEKFVDVPLNIDLNRLSEIIEKYAVSSVGEYPYSFELNFDKKNDSVKQKIIIEPQVILPLNSGITASVTRINYFDKISENKDLYLPILRSFGFNTTNIKKYIDTDNSIVFVENYGSIRMYSDGLLEYRALDDTKGIALDSSSNTSAGFYDNFIDCIEFVNNVWDTALASHNMDINLSSVSSNDSDGSFRLTIDYYADGMEVISRLKKTDTHEKINHAIEITVKNSRIVSYRQIVNGYNSNNDGIEHMSVIEALDILMASDSIKSDTITDVYLAYAGDAVKTVCNPCWVAKTAENEIRIITKKR